MPQSLFKRKLMVNSIAIVLGSSLATPLYAAESEDSDAEEENVVVITGIQATLKRNLLEKREAESIIDVITAGDIGQFPDKNIAETLQRVPGLTINRGFAGEGNEVSIRGVDPELTQTLVNGQFVASTNWFSLSFNKRSFNMDLMPSELVSSIEVHKSPTASLDEGGVGGTVVIHTRKPLELDAGKIYASAEIMDNSLSNDNGSAFSGLYSWKNEANSFGVLATYSTSKTIGIGNKAENYWEEAWAVGGISQFRQNRDRETIDINAQFAPTDSLSFDLHYFETQLDADNTNQNFLLFGGCCGGVGDGSDGGRGGSDFINGSGTSPTTGIPLRGTLTGGGGNPSWAGWVLAQDVNSRKPKLTSDIIDLNFDYSGDSFNVHGSIGSTTADGGNGGNVNSLWGIDDDDPRWVSNGGDLSVDFDFTLPSGFFINVNGLDLNDPNWQTNRAVSLAEVSLFDEEDWFQGDVDFDVDFGQIQKIEIGLKYRDHKFGKSQTNFTIDSTALFPANATLGSSGFADGTITISDVLAAGSDNQFTRVNSSFDAAVRNNISGSIELLGASGTVTEEITSAYVQANFEGENYRGNFGVRYSETDVTGTTFADNTASSKFSRDANYSDFLPSFNLAYDLAEDIILRTSFAKVMSRAAYGTLNPALGAINPTQNTASSGNVAIDPFRANQYDLGIEWYMGDNDYFGAAIFYKDIDSFVTSGSVTDLVFEPNGDQNAPNDLESYTLTVPVQGKGGFVQGLEVNYQKSIDNFGFLANVTLSKSEGKNDAGEKFDLPGSSDLSYNITGYYANDDWEARVAYSYRDQYLAEGTAISGSLDVFEDQAYLDASLTWHATEYLDIRLEGVNLLEEETIQRHGDGSLESNRVTTANGARYYLKASVHF